MDKHAAFLKNLCRLCGNSVKNKADVVKKTAFKLEMLEKFNINIDENSSETHPEKICPPCKRLLYRVRESGNAAEISVSRTIEKWTSHVEGNCRCTSGKKGRPAKKRIHLDMSHEPIGSDTESGEEFETETERISSLEFKSLIENIPFMDRELAIVCAKKLAETFHFILLDKAAWDRGVDQARTSEEERARLWDLCCASEADKEVIGRENKNLINELLQDALKEQTKTDGEWKDDIDLRVAEIKAKEGMRVCPVCQTTMERTKRKCVNPACRVSLKAAEKEVQGTDVLGTAIVAPVRQYRHRVKQTQYGFVIDDNEEGHVIVNYKIENISECHDEFQHVASNNPDHQVKVLASDPVFVNPNSADALKEVLRRVGKAANVKRYYPDNPSAREWLNVTMDGSPYLASRKVIEDVLMSTGCGAEVLKQKISEHCQKCHGGQKCKAIQEFSWVVLRIGKLHVEMNMARHFIDLNWDIFLSKLASEIGFVSEAAQKFVRRGSDHHKTMSVLKVAHIGLWKEMLIPYVRDRLSYGSPLSVNNYLYKWMPEVGWKDATYSHIFVTSWNYLMALHVFRMGVRRNNAFYVKAGQKEFAPLFHRNSASKYALIDLHDR
ncbi:uncharacterized protein [Acropora muricata]|uniref:uncharacterized protein n=1 Tax=Acropora muricata TaxID=159855 RepID=UPI0034E3D91C